MLLTLLLLFVLNDIVYSFYLSANTFTWSEASAFCDLQCNSSAASIHNLDDQNYIAQIMNHSVLYPTYQDNLMRDDVWIGLTYTNISGTPQHEWLDATELNFTFWNDTATETDPLYDQFALSADNGYKWISYAADTKLRALCNSCDSVINKYIVNTKAELDFDAAEAFCMSNNINTHSISIHSDEDQQSIQRLLNILKSSTVRILSVWTGLSDPDNSSDWEWTDGSSFDYGTDLSGGVYPWNSNEPSYVGDYDGLCVEAKYAANFKWNDMRCSWPYAPACAIPSELCLQDNRWFATWPWNTEDHVTKIGCDGWHIDGQAVPGTQMMLVNKQWINYNAKMVAEMTFTISALYSERETMIGFEFFSPLDFCTRYRLSLLTWLGDWQLSISQHSVLDAGTTDHTTLNSTVLSNVSMNVSHQLRVEVQYGNSFRVTLDNDNRKSVYARDNNDGQNIYSGYVAISSYNMSVAVQSMYVSGAFTMQKAFDPLTAWPQCTSPPSGSPTLHPTVITNAPTEGPTTEPTGQPTTEPTEEPTTEPTEGPTNEPTDQPTNQPTEYPTNDPTENPSLDPTENPSNDPTTDPSYGPTESPSIESTELQLTESPMNTDSAATSYIAGGAGLCFCCLCVAMALYLFWRKKKKNAEPERKADAAHNRQTPLRVRSISQEKQLSVDKEAVDEEKVEMVLVPANNTQNDAMQCKEHIDSVSSVVSDADMEEEKVEMVSRPHKDSKTEPGAAGLASKREVGGKEEEDVVEHPEVKEWLERTVKLSQYYAIFIEHGIEDLDGIQYLNTEQLEKMGIRKIGHQNKILHHAKRVGIAEMDDREMNETEGDAVTAEGPQNEDEQDSDRETQDEEENSSGMYEHANVDVTARNTIGGGQTNGQHNV